MRFTLALLAVVPAVFGALRPESRARPSRRGFSTISGVCDPSYADLGRYSGRDGTLKSCTQLCDDNARCKGLNFKIDMNECSLFSTECEDAQSVDAAAPKENFYVKGEIACGTSTVGSEFWLAFMSNRVAQPRNQDLEIWVTQDEILDGTVVRLEADGIDQEIQVPYKTAVKTVIPYTWKMTDLDSGVSTERKGLKLTSNSDFVFYGVNKEYFTADAYLGIPSSALGTRYIANCHFPPKYNCEFAFAPSNDQTTITVTLPRKQADNVGNWSPRNSQPCELEYQGQRFTNGQSFSITLDTFQVTQIQEKCDLTGAIIESDKPIAFWSGNSRVNIGGPPSRDHQVEELFSTDTWGTSCAAWPTPNRQPGLVDFWVITAADDDTTVEVYSAEGNTEMYRLGSAESVRFPATSVTDYMFFTSTKKFQAVKYAGSADPSMTQIPGDPAMTVCIPAEQFGFGYTFVTPSGVATSYDNFLSLVVKQGDQDGFLLDGRELQGINWQSFPNSDLVGGHVELDKSRSQFRIEHRVRGTQFEAYIYGAGDRESYAYPTGACIQQTGTCQRSQPFMADGKDNDCDGVIDEELLDGIDNDFDGEIDEDFYAVGEAPKEPEDRCPAVKTAQACYNGFLNMNCDEGRIRVISAHYGRQSGKMEMTCNSDNVMDACSGNMIGCDWEDVSMTVGYGCNGEQQCQMPAAQFHSMANSCPTCSQYAHVQYVCLTDKELAHGVMSAVDYKASSYLPTTVISNACGKSSATAGDQHTADKANHGSNAVEAWRPASCDKDSSWLAVDMGSQYAVGWYSISGCRRNDYWTATFTISYSQDGRKWTTVTDSSGQAVIFEANSDSNTAMVCTLFQYGIVARYMRIHPKDYNDWPCAHVDFGHSSAMQGCQAEPVANSNWAQGGSIGAGTSCKVQCNAGWATASGQAEYSVSCSADSQWDRDFERCDNLLHCPDIPTVKNGYATGPNNLPGARIRYYCDNGYMMDGSEYAECQQNGEWSAPAPNCYN